VETSSISQPTLVLKSTSSQHPQSRMYYLTNDVFDPNFAAVLCSECKNNCNTFHIILDTGCSFAMTYDSNDFVSPPVYDDWGSVQTASETMPLTAFGTIHWNVQTVTGSTFTLTVPVFLVPNSNVKLISPQDYVRYHGLPTNIDHYGGNALEFWMNLQDGTSKVIASIVSGIRLPVMIAQSVPTNCFCGNTTLSDEFTNVLSTNNQNLSPTQKLLMLDHCRLGHLNFQHLQSLYKPKTNIHLGCDKQGESTPNSLSYEEQGELNKQPCLKPKLPGLLSCPIPKCKACLLSKAKSRPQPGKTTTQDATASGAIKRDDIMPGDKISLDHYQSSVRGRLENTFGQEKESSQHIGGTLFVDHASGLILTFHQPTLGTSDTLRSLGLSEQFFEDHNVTIKQFHTDNGVFTSQEFRQLLNDNNYRLSLSGVGAHHQNGVAERAIQTVMWKARTMLIHLQIYWPDHFKANLWPFALTYAAWMHNHTPTQDLGFAPIELFSGIRLHCYDLRRIRVFGCPTYVLDPRLQDGFKIPKWEPRARLGQFLGFSTTHSTTVSLIRNL
jgi:hypothetical protein